MVRPTYARFLVENTPIIAHEIDKLRLQILEPRQIKTKKPKINRINFENSDNVSKCFPYIYIYFYPELISDVLLWTPTHGRAKAGRPARTYIQQLCEDTGCCPEDLPRAMNDREEWRERVRDIRATSAI